MTTPSFSASAWMFYIFLALFFLSPAGKVEGSGILDFGVSKSQRFIQEDENLPEALTEEGYLFISFFTVDNPGRVASGTVTLPNGESRSLVGSPFSSSFFHVMLFDEAAELHQAYPFGTYTFELTVDDVVHNATLQLTEVPFPGIPHITNYTDLQDLDADEPFTVEWAPISGATVNDYIFLDIEDWEPDNLSRTDTSTLVPEGVLEEAVNESVLTFARVVDRNTGDIPDAMGVAMVASWTEFNITANVGSLGGFQILTASIPSAQLNQLYVTSLNANEPVFLWLVEDDDMLPNGISLDPSTGQLSGIPLEAGSFSFVVLAVSSSSFEIALRQLTLTIASGEMPPVIGETSFEGGLFSLKVSSPNGQSIQIEVSTDLTAWSPLTIVDPIGGEIHFQDAESSSLSTRFYRVRWK